MARTLRGIGDEDLALRRCGVPEYFRDVPGAISVEDKQAVAKRLEFLLNAKQRLGSWALQKGPGLGVNRCSEKIVRRSIANVEMDGGGKRSEFDKIRGAKTAFFVWGPKSEGCST